MIDSGKKTYMYLITWHFCDTLISWFWGSQILLDLQTVFNKLIKCILSWFLPNVSLNFRVMLCSRHLFFASLKFCNFLKITKFTKIRCRENSFVIRQPLTKRGFVQEHMLLGTKKFNFPAFPEFPQKQFPTKVSLALLASWG